MANAELDLIVKLVDEASADLQKIKGEINNVGDEALDADKKTSLFSDNMKSGFNVLSGAVAAAAAVVSIAFIDMIGSAAEFEQSMSDISTLLGAGEKASQELKDGVLDLQKTMAVTPEELGASSYAAISGGFTEASDTLDILTNSSKLAISGLGSLDEATKLLVVATNAFGFEAEDSDKVADILFKTVKNGITTVGDLSGAFGKMAGNAVAANISLEDASAATAALSAITGQTSESQNALSQIFLELTKSGGTLDKNLGDVGFSLDDLNSAIVDEGLVGGMQSMVEQMGISETEFKNMFSSAEGGTAVFQLLTAGVDTYMEANGQMLEGVNEMEAAWEKQQETFSSQSQLMSNNIDALKIIIGSEFLPIINEWTTKLVGWLQDFSSGLQETGIKEWLEENKTTLIVLASVIGGLFVTAIVAATIALGSILGPALAIGAVITVIGIQIGLLISSFLEMKNSLEAWIPGIQQKWEEGWNAIGAKVGEIKESIDSKVAEIRESISSRIEDIKSSAVTGFEALKTGVMSVFESVSSFFTTIWDGISAIFKFGIALITGLVITAFELLGVDIIAVFTAIKEKIDDVWGTIQAGFEIALNFISELWMTIWGGIREFTFFLWEEMSMLFTEKIDSISLKIEGSLEFINELWQSVWNGISSFTSGILNTIKTIFTGAFNSITALLLPWIETVETAWDGLWESFANAAINAWEGAKNIIKEGINWIIEKVNTLINAINEVVSKGAALLGISAPTISTIPLLADGGNITRAGSAIVGEAGPELISLPRGAQVTPLSGDGAGITIIINNPMVLSDDDIIEKLGDPIIQVLKQHMATV